MGRGTLIPHPLFLVPSHLKNREVKGRDHASLHSHAQGPGGYLVFDRSDISLLPVINGVGGFAFPVWGVEGVVAAGARRRHSESSHLLNHLFTGLGRGRRRPGISRATKANSVGRAPS